MKDRRLQATCEVLREAGVLIAVLYPLEKGVRGGVDFWWLAGMELMSMFLIFCGIILDKERNDERD